MLAAVAQRLAAARSKRTTRSRQIDVDEAKACALAWRCRPVATVDRASGIVERVGCRVADARDQLTWAIVCSRALRVELTHDPASAIGRDAIVTYTHRTIAGALREARLTTLLEPCQAARSPVSDAETCRSLVKPALTLPVQVRHCSSTATPAGACGTSHALGGRFEIRRG